MSVQTSPPTASLRAEVIVDAAGLTALQPEWQQLWRAQARREIFCSPGWCVAAWQSRRPQPQLHLVAVRRGDRLAGLLALVREAGSLAFMGSPWADYNDMLVDDADPAAVVAVGLACAFGPGTPGRGRLAEIPEWSHLARHCGALPARLRQRIATERGADCPALRLGDDREALLDEMASKKSLKRHEKKLERIGKVTLRHLTDRAEAQGALADFFDQHICRRAVAGDRSLFLNPESRAFYATLIQHLDPAEELRFAVLAAGDRPVAYHFGFEVAGRFTWYKPSFDVDLLETGAGEVLIKRLLEYVKGRPVHEFDFTRGNESFKDRFSNHRGFNQTWLVRSSRLSAGLARLRNDARDRARRMPWIVALRRLLMKPATGAIASRAAVSRWQSTFQPNGSTRLPASLSAAPIGLRELARIQAGLDQALAQWLKPAVAAMVSGKVCIGVRDGRSLRGLAVLRTIDVDSGQQLNPAPAARTAVPATKERPREWDYHCAPGVSPAADELIALTAAITASAASTEVDGFRLHLPVDTGNVTLEAALRDAGFEPTVAEQT
jgi:CelD/BcsL family acetyltransferase involved in cellulose biosynthesis